MVAACSIFGRGTPRISCSPKLWHHESVWTRAPKFLAKDLFEPYVTSKPTGTGLGLWLSKRIIARHKGTVRFTTSQLAGKNGSSFYISLPASISA